MIIHILGNSGSGKTTLGKKLSKLENTIVLDTDEIDDVNSIKLLKKYKKEDAEFNKEKSKLNKEELYKFIQKNASKNIIFVGFNFGGMENIPRLASLKYLIKIDPDTLFRQYNLRTLNIISENIKEIELLLQNKKITIQQIMSIIIYKYKIRQGFLCNISELKDSIKKKSKRDKKRGYKVKTSDKIFKEIKEKIEKKM
jgi:shikimate kinase